MAQQQQSKPTVYQRLSKLFGTGGQPEVQKQSSISAKELLTATSAEELMLKRLEAQQSQYLGNQFEKLTSNLYQQTVYYETTRLASYGDFEAMEFCCIGSTPIPTPEGFITIKELAEKGRDYEFITYAYDFSKKCIVPAKAKNAHYTRDEMTYKIIFDNDSYFIGTWEHRLLKRDGSFEKIKNLKEGDSMMPFYRKSFYKEKRYNWIYTTDPNQGHRGWVTEHKLIGEWAHGKLAENEIFHHIDFNSKNNMPENLFKWDSKEHQAFHCRHNNKKLWANPEYRKKMIEISKRTDNKHKWNGARSGKNNPAYFHLPWDNIVEAASITKTLKKTAKLLNVSHRKIQREIVENGYKDWIAFLEAYNIKKSKHSSCRATGDKILLNHKIKKIEPYKIVPVYDLSVPGYKNFATDTIFSHNTPEISASLDLISEESCTLSEFGKMLQVFSNSRRVKTVLENLFNNVLDINVNLPAWVRNTAKYGDNFVYLKSERGKGIVAVKQLPNIEIRREESSITDQKNVVRFVWQGKDMEFTAYQIAHFRLLGDDRHLPYGTSFLEKARKIWKQLVLSEDAMLVYRISRAAERRIFKIDVGNMDDKDVEAHIQKVAQKLGKRTPQAENTGNFTGQVDVRFNTLSVDQDFFLPTRAGGGVTEIDTLPGATNLDQISDIEYIQRKLFTAMRIPKAFLGFEEAVGEGKNLALQDIRFARTINRIQQSMIQELNKIAIIHLYMLGFEEELDNFTLSLNSPSTQAEMLKIEQWKEKILLYRDMVSDAGNGFAATSMTWAKRNILNFSDDEINLDLNQQRIEKAAGKENEAPEQIIHTGLFDNLDKRYQKKEGEELPEASPEEGAPGEIPGLGGGGSEMGGPGEELPPIAAAGGPEAGGGELPEIKEEKSQLLESKYKILDDNSKVLNEDLKSMLKEIDNILNEGEEIKIKKIIDNNEDLKD